MASPGPSSRRVGALSMADPVLTGTMKVPVERGPADSGVAVESFAPLPRYTPSGPIILTLGDGCRRFSGPLAAAGSARPLVS